MATICGIAALMGGGVFLGLAMISESPADVLYLLLLLADLFK